ncbi:hypothetical protein BD770DRAFT_384245 [Pilaira anomala]|nr:hypothetical protein BD770DRAFT_384245 [Pilaira anomala]
MATMAIIRITMTVIMNGIMNSTLNLVSSHIIVVRVWMNKGGPKTKIGRANYSTIPILPVVLPSVLLLLLILLLYLEELLLLLLPCLEELLHLEKL